MELGFGVISMVENLFVTTAVVILLWILILGIFLFVSRNQPDIQSRMKALDEQLNESENKGQRQ
jgi:hypothetical protein